MFWLHLDLLHEMLWAGPEDRLKDANPLLQGLILERDGR